ncbi:type III pantothenate kinase [Xylella fastidiosa subsp. fastidiosa]|jgi:type III pantothenate kinase|uniref:Type III pantothenate kinase n=2 Tax=Xylella fastidiosa TaxID=2371 RepID=COAX_XYLFT|nr:type III pantothenate kinase [Xylella fastidiosa]B2I5C0.1 RecName: Full=Type III pantothenate kinase; AltName: Full=PanK-III; AltName: Full=Pantothenic acid kinase [Xylella fastidiosa M23]Q87CJ5.1 RecName: Full=Type III pantothenate kinase; AltName: Full=PanK-III; AltName: Full=Pantothenic acid kinase [Xylella fastidiosa Temecula1]ADN64085.1 pantothenate kinase [Xylella fastidiosa subsp. fastidiosa GB514]KAF0570341.1 pantothenate kinase [Xylella fastidiosa subsp. fastidiosa Mus-1]AAO28930.1
MNDWLFDLGNSRFKCASLREGVIGPVTVLPYLTETMDAFALQELPRGRVAYLASVAAPAITTHVLEVLKIHFEKVQVAATVAACAGVRIAYAHPERFGVDRFLALLGSYGEGNVLVVGVGTALTIDLLAANGCHLGGRISASPTLMRQALHARAEQLPLSGGNYLEFAEDTEDALVSGCNGAAVALIERSLYEAHQRLDQSVRLLLHGGGVASLLPWLGDVVHRPKLVLDGLAIWAAVAANV